MSSSSTIYVQPSPLSTFNPYSNTIQSSLKTTTSKPLSHQPHLPNIPLPTDSGWIGEKIHEFPHGFRFLLQNPNGLDLSNKLNEFGLLLENITRYKIDMLLLPESNINPHNFELIENLRAATDLHLHHALFNSTNTPGFPASQYQPGGVTTILQGNLLHRFATTCNDHAGRWACSSFRGKTRQLKVYTLYRVCDSSSSGPTTAYSQQEQFFLSRDKVVNPRQQVINDLLPILESDISKGFDIILSGDFNEALNGTTSQSLEALGLIDIISTHIDDPPRTYRYGKNCIDQFWATSTVAHTVTSVGFAPFDFLQVSDHRAIYVDLNLSDILDNDSFHIPPVRYRRLKSNSVSSVSSYKKSINRLTKKHKICNSINRIIKCTNCILLFIWTVTGI